MQSFPTAKDSFKQLHLQPESFQRTVEVGHQVITAVSQRKLTRLDVGMSGATAIRIRAKKTSKPSSPTGINNVMALLLQQRPY